MDTRESDWPRVACHRQVLERVVDPGNLVDNILQCKGRGLLCFETARMILKMFARAGGFRMQLPPQTNQSRQKEPTPGQEDIQFAPCKNFANLILLR